MIDQAVTAVKSGAKRGAGLESAQGQNGLTRTRSEDPLSRPR